MFVNKEITYFMILIPRNDIYAIEREKRKNRGRRMAEII